MQVYNTFFKIAKKNFSSILQYFFIFAVLAFLLSNSSETSNYTYDLSSKLNISILDEDKSALSEELCAYMEELHYVDGYFDSEEDILDSLYYHQIDYVLVIPKGYEEQLTSGNYDNLVENVKVPNSYNGSYVDEQLNEYFNCIKLYTTGGYSLEEATSLTKDNLDKELPVQFFSSEESSSSKDTSIYYFFQYLPYIFICLLLNGLTPILTTFQQENLRKRIQCSSLSFRQLNGELGLGSATYCAATWLVFMLLAILVFKGEFFSIDGLYCMINSFCFLLVAAALTFFASCFSVSKSMLNMISNVFGLGFSFIGGIFVPLSLLGDAVIKAAHFTPTYWYVRANNMLAGFSGNRFTQKEFLLCIAMELLFATALVALALALRKIHQKK